MSECSAWLTFPSAVAESFDQGLDAALGHAALNSSGGNNGEWSLDFVWWWIADR
jgi:hypothetical protein